MTLKCWGSNGLSRAFLLPARLLFFPPTHFPFTQAIPASASPQAPALAFPRGREALCWADARGSPGCPGSAAVPAATRNHLAHVALLGAGGRQRGAASRATSCLVCWRPKLHLVFCHFSSSVFLLFPSPGPPRKVSLFPPAPTQAPLSLALQLLPAPCRHSLLLPAVPDPAASQCGSPDRSHDFLLLLAAGAPPLVLSRPWSSALLQPLLCRTSSFFFL